MLIMIDCSTGLYVGECSQGPQEIGGTKRTFKLENAVKFQFSYFPIMVQQQNTLSGQVQTVPQIIENRQDHWQPLDLLLVTESYAWGWLQDNDKLSLLYADASRLRQQQADNAQIIELPKVAPSTGYSTEHLVKRHK